MKEDFLHYLWKFQKFDQTHLFTEQGEKIKVFQAGFHNQDQSGPDFFNARLSIEMQMWAGNVEIHLKSSDWYTHHHETDQAYDSVILHVVWEHDVEVYRKDNSVLPTLSLAKIVDENTLIAYQNLMKKEQKWINCEHFFPQVDNSLLHMWIERLYIERLESKASHISALAKTSNYNWESVAFQVIAKNFGLNVNGDYFFQLAQSISFSLIQKYSHQLLQLEALLLGQANLLEDSEDIYVKNLHKEYSYLQQKHQLVPLLNKPQFFRLRPPNFPSIRLAQLASLYHNRPNLFTDLMKAKSKKEIASLMQVEVSEFWKTHYHISSESKPSKKKLTSKMIDLFIINTIIPLKFAYQKYLGNTDISEDIWKIMRNLASENNSIINKFEDLKSGIANSAVESQALIHLKKNYCDRLACLKCSIGLNLLKQNDTRN